MLLHDNDGSYRNSGRVPQPITVALVNNMPDSAFVDTENQFRRAAEGPDGAEVNFELYTITDIPRSEAIGEVIESRYQGLDQLWRNPPDAMIVTGTEPTQVQLSLRAVLAVSGAPVGMGGRVGPHHAALVSRLAREHPAIRRDRAGVTHDQVQWRVPR